VKSGPNVDKEKKPRDAVSVEVRGGPIAATIGRVQAAPGALIIGQERALRHLEGAVAHAGEHRTTARRMGREFPGALRGVKLRLGGPNLLDDIKRVWTSKRNTLPMKLLGTLGGPGASLRTIFSRADHYNPYTDTAVVYSGLPSVTAHELGHAADFNKRSPWGRTAYSLAHIPESLPSVLGFPGPVTLWQELAANRNAMQALGKGEGAAEQKREAWRRLAPAFSTYGTAATLGGLYLHHRNTGGGRDTPYTKLTKPFLRGAEWLIDRIGGDKYDKMDYAPALASFGLMGAGALIGRGVAEVRNLLARFWESRSGSSPKKRTKESPVTREQVRKAAEAATAKAYGAATATPSAAAKPIKGTAGTSFGLSAAKPSIKPSVSLAAAKPPVQPPPVPPVAAGQTSFLSGLRGSMAGASPQSMGGLLTAAAPLTKGLAQVGGLPAVAGAMDFLRGGENLGTLLRGRG
jgi:hypothetical protein